MRQKIESSDAGAYEWGWQEKFGQEVSDDLSAAYAQVLANAAPEMEPGMVQQLAGQYADARGAELVKGLEAETRKRMALVVEQSIQAGEGIGTLQRKIRADFAFSRERATLIARTETAKALGQGQKVAAISQGRDEKRWFTQGDDRVRPEHRSNAAAGWLGVADAFPSGEDTIGLPNCRCNVVYRTRSIQVETISEGVKHRCPDCHKILGKNKEGPGYYCRRCRKAVISEVKLDLEVLSAEVASGEPALTLNPEST